MVAKGPMVLRLTQIWIWRDHSHIWEVDQNRAVQKWEARNWMVQWRNSKIPSICPRYSSAASRAAIVNTSGTRFQYIQQRLKRAKCWRSVIWRRWASIKSSSVKCSSTMRCNWYSSTLTIWIRKIRAWPLRRWNISHRCCATRNFLWNSSTTVDWRWVGVDSNRIWGPSIN